MSRSVLLGFLSGKPRWCIWSHERIFPSLILKIRGKKVKAAEVVAAQLPVAYFKTSPAALDHAGVVQSASQRARVQAEPLVSKVLCWCIIVSGWAREQCSKKEKKKNERKKRKGVEERKKRIIMRDRTVCHRSARMVSLVRPWRIWINDKKKRKKEYNKNVYRRPRWTTRHPLCFIRLFIFQFFILGEIVRQDLNRCAFSPPRESRRTDVASEPNHHSHANTRVHSYTNT